MLFLQRNLELIVRVVTNKLNKCTARIGKGLRHPIFTNAYSLHKIMRGFNFPPPNLSPIAPRRVTKQQQHKHLILFLLLPFLLPLFLLPVIPSEELLEQREREGQIYQEIQYAFIVRAYSWG